MFFLLQNTPKNNFFLSKLGHWIAPRLQHISSESYWLRLAYKYILINCVNLIKRVDLSEMCCTHWVDVLAESLLNFSTRLMESIQIRHLPNLRYSVAQHLPHTKSRLTKSI